MASGLVGCGLRVYGLWVLGRVLGFRRRTLICEENDSGMGRILQFILDIANPGGLKGLGFRHFAKTLWWRNKCLIVWNFARTFLSLEGIACHCSFIETFELHGHDDRMMIICTHGVLHNLVLFSGLYIYRNCLDWIKALNAASDSIHGSRRAQQCQSYYK